jgi:hypothetical protein
MYNIIYNMPITHTNIIECEKYQKYAFKHIFSLDLDYTWTAAELHLDSLAVLALTWTLPGL